MKKTQMTAPITAPVVSSQLSTAGALPYQTARSARSPSARAPPSPPPPSGPATQLHHRERRAAIGHAAGCEACRTGECATGQRLLNAYPTANQQEHAEGTG